MSERNQTPECKRYRKHAATLATTGVKFYFLHNMRKLFDDLHHSQRKIDESNSKQERRQGCCCFFEIFITLKIVASFIR